MRTKKARVGKRRRSGAATKARLAGNEKGRRASTAQVQQRLKGNPTAASRMPKATKARAAKRMSVLDAASAGKLMRAEEMIAQMESKGLWTSPGSKTPEATLYAATAA
jgi:hypothetical protein